MCSILSSWWHWQIQSLLRLTSRSSAAGNANDQCYVGIQFKMPSIHPPAPLNASTRDIADEWKMWKQMWDNYCVLTNLSSQPEFETYQYQTALLFHSMAFDLMVSESSMACNYLMIQTAKSVVSIVIREKLGLHFFGERKEFFERFKSNRLNQESEREHWPVHNCV